MAKNYRLLRNLGGGGFGSVDLVEGEDGTLFARKTFIANPHRPANLQANVRKRFKREAQYQAGIRHLNIVPVIEADLDADPPWYVMPLAEGTLHDDIQRDRTLGGRISAALSDIVAGLSELHSMKIYHRDLKPQNILRFVKTKTGEAKTWYALSDFGLISVKESQISQLTSTGMKRNSDFFAAPEVIKALSQASAQSDIFSLGCILHEVVGTHERVPCNEIRETGPFASILLGCTRKDPSQRFKSARAVLDAVLTIELTGPPPSKESTDFIAELQAEKELDAGFWNSLADYLEHADKFEKRAVCATLTAERILEVASRAPAAADRIGAIFAHWVGQSTFDFGHCDGLADRLEAFYEKRDFEVKVECLIAMLQS